MTLQVSRHMPRSAPGISCMHVKRHSQSGSAAHPAAAVQHALSRHIEHISVPSSTMHTPPLLEPPDASTSPVESASVSEPEPVSADPVEPLSSLVPVVVDVPAPVEDVVEPEAPDESPDPASLEEDSELDPPQARSSVTVASVGDRERMAGR